MVAPLSAGATHVTVTYADDYPVVGAAMVVGTSADRSLTVVVTGPNPCLLTALA